MLKNVLAAASCATLLCLAFPAFASPFVDVTTAWGARPGGWFGVPAGVSVSCRGDATGTGGCGNILSLGAMPAESTSYSISSSGSLVLTNTSDHAISGFAEIEIWFSAFNPGGPQIGLGIDDAAMQGAHFSSSVTGDGNVSDAHACSLGTHGTSGTQFSPTTCGVAYPDYSMTATGLDLVDFLPGEEIVFTWTSIINAEFALGDDAAAGVPEPDGLYLAALGLGALCRVRRKTKAG